MAISTEYLFFFNLHLDSDLILLCDSLLYSSNNSRIEHNLAAEANQQRELLTSFDVDTVEGRYDWVSN